MGAVSPTEDRAQTFGEEVANSLSHGLGCLLAVASLPILVHFSAQRGGAVGVLGVSLFSATMILLYLVSALYHALPAGLAKHWFNRLDHAAIFLFIAGSYMPYLLGVLHGAWRWTLLGIVCSVAALGVVAKLCNRLRRPLWSTGLYLALGWVAMIAAPALVERLPSAVLGWLLAGGLAYSAGAVVFHFDSRLRYGHFAWHLFVLAGTICHFVAVLLQVA
jgi:hemolysin III